MAGGSLPRGGKSAYFRRLSEFVPKGIRTRVTEFIESVVFEDELAAALAALEVSGETTVSPHDHDSLYALIDHSHSEYSLLGHTHSWPKKLSNLSDVGAGVLTVGDILAVSDLGVFQNGPPVFNDALFSLHYELDNTALAEFDLSGISDHTTRTIALVDADMTIPSTVNHDDLTDGGLTYLHTHDHDLLYGVGYYTHYEIDEHLEDTDNPHSVIADQVDFAVLSGYDPEFTSTQDFMNNSWSSGRISGFELSDGGSNTVSVAAGEGVIADTDDESARVVYAFDFAGGSTAVIADGTTKYIFMEYNSGTPQIALSDIEDLDRYDAFELGWVTREGATLHVINAPQNGGNIPHRVGHTLRETQGIKRADKIGGILLATSNDGNRKVSVSAGEFYYGTNEFDIAAVNTATTGTFTRYYRVAGTWTAQTGLTVWPNLQYTDGTNLQNMTPNRYGCLWFYVDIEDNELVMLYGTSNATSLLLAQEEAPPAAVPPRVSGSCVLIGRIVYQQNGSNRLLVQSVFNTAFNASGAADHLLLTNIGTNTHAQIDTFIGTTVPGTYLPLTAGSTKPLTGDLYIDSAVNPDNPSIFLRNCGDADSYSTIQDDSASIMFIRKVSKDEYPIIEIDPIATDGTSGASVRMFRNTNTTNSAATGLFLYKGDGSGTVQHSFLSKGDAVICGDTGNCVIGTGGGRTIIGTPASAGATLFNGSISFYLDEAGHNLKIEVKYSDGTTKTGTLALT